LSKTTLRDPRGIVYDGAVSMGNRRDGIVGGVCIVLALLVGCAHTPPAQPRASGDAQTTIVLDARLMNDSPGAVMPWTAYAIALGIEAKKTGYLGDYKGELKARAMLADAWRDLRGQGQPHRDAYLDALVGVADAGFMPEYVLSFLARPGWIVPAHDLAVLKLAAFKEWIPGHLGRQHRVQTHASVAPSSGLAEPPVPGADLPGGLDPQSVPCASLEPEIMRALDAWNAAEARLRQMPLSVSSTEEVLPALQHASRDPRAMRDGVVLVSPQVASTMFVAGFCAVERNAFPEAEKYLRRAVALWPTNANIRGELVQTLIVQKRLDDADAELDMALPLAASPCHLAVLWRKRGYILFDRGKLVDSYHAYAHSLEYDPESAIAHREMQLIVTELRRSGGYDEKAFKASGPPPPSGMSVKVCH
jgi:hypothetical protein